MVTPTADTLLPPLHIPYAPTELPLHALLQSVRTRSHQEAWSPQRSTAHHLAHTPLQSLGRQWLRPRPIMPAPYIDFHTHTKGVANQLPTTSEKVLVIQSLFYPSEKPHSRADFVTVGIHPMQEDARQHLTEIRKDREKCIAHFEECIGLSTKRVVAIGESGWDKRSLLTPKEQTELLLFQAEISQKLALPMALHVVGSWHLLLATWKQFSTSSTPPWIIHGFRGKPALQEQLYQAGLHLSYHPYYIRSTEHLPTPLLLESDDTSEDIRKIYHQAATKLRLTTHDLRSQIHAHATSLLQL